MPEHLIRNAAAEGVNAVFGEEISPESIAINETRKEFEGDLTVVVFPFTRFSKKSPEATGEQLGEWMKENVSIVVGFNVVKGFLNLVIDDGYWWEFFSKLHSESQIQAIPSKEQKVVLEYCGPNTNKPLHLGHIRNMLIGYSLSEILKAAGYEMHRVNIYNDRGIAICKSMLAWQKFGDGETPESANMKGDHFVGKYYVKFDIEYRRQIDELVEAGRDRPTAEREAPLLLEAQEMLRKWEAGDKEVVALWEKMNSWVYTGFDQTYNRIGIDFEKDYKESEFYLKGKEMVLSGLDEEHFYRKDDQSVWVDFTDQGLDEKLLIRSDGTSVYITQDLGVAEARYEDFGMEKLFYVVGDEQNYHFKVLKLLLQKMGRPYADGLTHVSYGMVDLPDGKMKSREGTTVDADDLMDEMFSTAKQYTSELGKAEGLDSEASEELFRKIGLGALKFFILRVNPKKRILFNPQESIDFQGFTGPFIQYTYARIQSVLRKAENQGIEGLPDSYALNEIERELIIQLYNLPRVIESAAENLDPSELASYAFNLAKVFNKFYAENSILKAEEYVVRFRVDLSRKVADCLQSTCLRLGIEMPDRM